MSRPIRALLLPLLVVLTGCHSYLVPFDERPLLAPHPLAAANGERLDVDPAGGLQVRPARGDLEAVFGVGLQASAAGLVVTHRLRPGTPLRPDDRIVAAVGVVPPATNIEGFAEAVEARAKGTPPGPRPAGRGGRPEANPDEPPPPPKPVELPAPPADAKALRAQRAAHRVRALDDLRPYLVAPGACLDLVVVRSGAEVVVRQPLAEPHQWLPVRLWSPHATRWHGIDLVRVEDLPPEHRPADASLRDFLVVRVARDAPAGRAGLRPLDVVSNGDAFYLLGGRVSDWATRLQRTLTPASTDSATLESPVPLLEEPADDAAGAAEDDEARQSGRVVARVRKPDGQVVRLEFEPRRPATELWFPFVFSYHTDGVRSHLGLGPFDLLFHHSSRVDYDPETDDYVSLTRWSVGTSIQGGGVSSQAGTDASGGVSPFLDGVRMRYLMDWLSVPDETSRRRGWLGEGTRGAP